MTDCRRWIVVALLGAVVPSAAVDRVIAAQTPAAAQEARRPGTLLKVDVVLTRQKGDKKISSLPYSLLVSERQSRLRVGVDLPGEILTSAKDGVTSSRRETFYIGTSIDATAELAAPLPAETYRLFLSISETSFAEGSQPKGPAPFALRTFSASNYLYVRDGQSLTFSVGTDQVTGETLRADVTVSLVK